MNRAEKSALFFLFAFCKIFTIHLFSYYINRKNNMFETAQGTACMALVRHKTAEKPNSRRFSIAQEIITKSYQNPEKPYFSGFFLFSKQS